MIKTFIKKLNIVILLVGFILYSSSLPTLLLAQTDIPLPGEESSGTDSSGNPYTLLLPPPGEGNEIAPDTGDYTYDNPYDIDAVTPYPSEGEQADLTYDDVVINGYTDARNPLDWNNIPEQDNNILADNLLSTPDLPGDTEAALDTAIRQVNKSTAGRPSQAQAYTSGSSTSVQAGTPAKSAASCFAGTLLSNLLTSTISTAINSVVGAAETVVGTAIGLLSVPVADWNVKLDTVRTKEQLQFQSAAHTGTTIGFAGINGMVNISWDAVGYCIVNSMIDYIARSTIAWAKSGFQGNPSFVDNPEQFFKQLGDLEAGAFLQQIAYGVIGQNICQPFRAQIVLTIARDYLGTGYYGSDGYANGGYGGGAGNRTFGGCSLSNIKGDLKAFLGGDFRRGGWDSWLKISQVQANNPYSTYLNLSAQMYGRTQQKKDLANLELSWGKGFLSFRKCDSKTAEKDKSKCPITTPGNLIEDQLNKTLNISKDRLVLAEKFDQVIAVIVNELINTALNKVLN